MATFFKNNKQTKKKKFHYKREFTVSADHISQELYRTNVIFPVASQIT